MWRNGLFNKLINCEFSTKILGILKNLCENTFSYVKFSRGLTNLFTSGVRVRQGCSLSLDLFNIFINDLIELFSPSDHPCFPVLCNIFINDLTELFSSSDHPCFPVKLKSVSLNYLLFADDLTLLSKIETGIQNCLNKLHLYCNKRCLQINMKGTQYLKINRNGKQRKCELYLETRL